MTNSRLVGEIVLITSHIFQHCNPAHNYMDYLPWKYHHVYFMKNAKQFYDAFSVKQVSSGSRNFYDMVQYYNTSLHTAPLKTKGCQFDNFVGHWWHRKLSLYPPHNEVVGGVYWFHSVRPSVCPSVRLSVRPSVRPACSVRSVSSTVMDGFFSY